jgi:hypothetical protein
VAEVGEVVEAGEAVATSAEAAAGVDETVMARANLEVMVRTRLASSLFVALLLSHAFYLRCDA